MEDYAGYLNNLIPHVTPSSMTYLKSWPNSGQC